jgi:hypothetical protein
LKPILADALDEIFDEFDVLFAGEYDVEQFVTDSVNAVSAVLGVIYSLNIFSNCFFPLNSCSDLFVFGTKKLFDRQFEARRIKAQ